MSVKESSHHKAGFVSIVGKPNVGKSTLMNALVGERLSIITHKAQTTRHRILGILSGDDFQVIYSDTPGVLKPEYKLHQSMMRFVDSALEDGDVILWLVELGEKNQDYEDWLDRLKKVEAPVILVINKIDKAVGSQLVDKIAYWQEQVNVTEIIGVSALENTNVEKLFERILHYMPEHPAYFPKEDLTDKPERFFVAEMIREQIFQHYKKEIPYSTEVEIESFEEEDKIIHISAVIYVERKSQKAIIIGKDGKDLKAVGTAARLNMEKFFGKKVFLQQYAKVAPDWRRNERALKNFGYKN
ncbi:MAG: GTPase Era [Cyclobacteriaceae bacterium]|nr:GTPase Era [Cyclobacteriaceae bacterium]MCH8517948.1 GTPase Era [Cyclobacteriaceae bacterium]